MPTDLHARTLLFPDTVVTGELLEALRLPADVARCELVDGVVYALTPQNRFHGEMLMHLGRLLDPPPGWRVLGGDVGIYLHRRPDTVRGPDLLAISDARYAATDAARAFLTVIPELLIEINSPSNEPDETADKIAAYLDAGGEAVVWVVDLEAETVAIHTRHVDVEGLTADRVVTATRQARLPLPWGDTLSVAAIFGGRR